MATRTGEKNLEIRFAPSGECLLEPETLELELRPDEILAATIPVRIPEGVRILGNAFTDSPRLSVSPSDFSANDLRLLVRASATGLSSGETLEGRVILSTNLGEKEVPVRLLVESRSPRSASGREIQNLDDFVSLAKDYYDEAFRFFIGKDFATLLVGEEPWVLALYESLTTHPVTYHRMEEFLIACHLKEPVVVTAESAEAAFFNLKESRKEVLTLRKSEWGSVKLEAEVSGSFLTLPKTRVVSEDFLGSVCEFEYILHRERLSAGKNVGTITLRSFYSSLTFRVTASREGALEMDRSSMERRGRLLLVREYMDRRLGVLDDRAFRAESLSRLRLLFEQFGSRMAYRLYEIFVEDMTGNREGAKRLLSTITSEELREEPLEQKAAYLYLGEKTGFFQKGQVDVVERIRDWQRRKQESLLLLLIWIRSDPDLARLPSRRFQVLEEAYGRGFRSPLVYLDAAELLRADERLLVRLTPFAQRVLGFAARNRWITRGLARRTAFLSGNGKPFSPRLFRLLETIYGQYAEDEVLEAICKLLIKGAPRRDSYFRWYERAVERDIRVTRLYEYFVETMPEDYQRVLPPAVLRYFLLVDTLADRRKAALYANIIRNRGKDRATYESYRPKMEAFAASVAANGRDDRNFAVICQEFIHRLPEGRAGESLARGAFAERIYTDDPRIREVVVRHNALRAEETVPVRGGEAYIHRYAQDACILLSDGKSHRYYNAVEYSAEPLMEREGLLAGVDASQYRTPGLWLYVVAPSGHVLPVSRANAPVYLCVVSSEAFTPSFRRRAEKALFDYLADNPEDDRFEDFLSGYDGSLSGVPGELPLAPGAVAALLARRGYTRNAFRILCKAGFEGMPKELLSEVARERIAFMEGESDPDTLALAARAFAGGQAGVEVLSYLVSHFDGPLDALLRLRRDANALGLATLPLDGRILRRAVLVGRCEPKFGEILGSFAASGGERAVTEAYLTFEARFCFGGSVPISKEAAALIAALHEEGKVQDGIRKLALLYYYAKSPRLSLREEDVAESLLAECALEGIRFSFFKELPASLLLQYHLEDRAFVEYRADSQDFVTLHYRLGRPGAEGEEREEPMKEMYGGIFSKEFVLFYGEILTWYVTVLHEGKERRTKTRTLSMEKVDMEGRSRYQLINQMLRSAGEENRRELRERIRDFRQAERMVERLFVPVCQEDDAFQEGEG